MKQDQIVAVFETDKKSVIQSQPDHILETKNFVRIENSHYMSKFHLMMKEYDAFCIDTGRRLPDDCGWGRDDHPAINISMIDTIYFINWLNQKRGLPPTYVLAKIDGDPWLWTHPGATKTGVQIVDEEAQRLGRKLTEEEVAEILYSKCCLRIPTEAQWEMSANTPEEKHFVYAGSDNVDEVAWYIENSDSHTHPVGQKKPNGYGLYDMSGNVWDSTISNQSNKDSGEIYPPLMTKESWEKNFPGIEYLDTSNEEIFNHPF
jgi:formylglycine-generating enzyme required for sulfatase activity